MAAQSLINASALFKDNYGARSDQTYNTSNVLLGTIKVKNDFTGKRRSFEQDLGFAGGVGSGSLPAYSTATYVNPLYSAKKVYGVTELDREAIKAAEDNKGAFVTLTKEAVKKCVEASSWNGSRILFGDGTGALGTADGSTTVTGAGTSGSPYVVVISAATWKVANWEENNFVNVGVETTRLLISAVNITTRAVSLVGTSALLAAVAGSTFSSSIIYLQNSKDNDPLGLKGVLDATTGTLYGVTVQRRWQAYQAASADAGITTDMMNEDMLSISLKCGKTPKLIITSVVQYKKFLNQLEDKKFYDIAARDPSLKGKFSFKGMEFMSDEGPVPVKYDRFCEDDRIYYLNPDYIVADRRPGWGWMDDDGTVFLRKTGEDAYEGRYGGYYENYIIPSFHGVRTGLAT